MGIHVDFINSSNNLVASHDGNADSFEEDPNKVDSDKHAPKIPNHNGNHSIFRYYMCSSGVSLDNLLNRQF